MLKQPQLIDMTTNKSMEQTNTKRNEELSEIGQLSVGCLNSDL